MRWGDNTVRYITRTERPVPLKDPDVTNCTCSLGCRHDRGTHCALPHFEYPHDSERSGMVVCWGFERRRWWHWFDGKRWRWHKCRPLVWLLTAAVLVGWCYIWYAWGCSWRG